MRCECDREFDTATLYQIHKLSGNCPAGKPARISRPTGSGYRTRRIAKPRRTVEQIEAQAREDRLHRVSTWHLALSVYYKAYGTKQRADGMPTREHLKEVDDAIMRALERPEFQQMVLDELGEDLEHAWGWKDDVEIVRVKGGYNTSHCHLNQTQKLQLGKRKNR